MSEIQTASTICNRCGTSAFASAKFCAECGTRLDDTGSAARNFAVGAVKNAGHYGKAVLGNSAVQATLRNPVAQKVAGGALVGAAVFSVIPFVSAAAGAVVGGGFVAYQRLIAARKDRDE